MYTLFLAKHSTYPGLYFQREREREREGGRRECVTQWIQRAKEVPVELKELQRSQRERSRKLVGMHKECLWWGFR